MDVTKDAGVGEGSGEGLHYVSEHRLRDCVMGVELDLRLRTCLVDGDGFRGVRWVFVWDDALQASSFAEGCKARGQDFEPLFLPSVTRIYDLGLRLDAIAQDDRDGAFPVGLIINAILDAKGFGGVSVLLCDIERPTSLYIQGTPASSAVH